MTIEAMKQALAVLEEIADEVLPEDYGQMVSEAITALRAAIEETEKQEPVAWMFVNTDGECEQIEFSKNWPVPDDPSVTRLYTAPRQWQGLTDEELAEFSDLKLGAYDLCLEVEAKLREKNHA